MIAEVSRVLYAAPLAALIGFGLGFVAGARFRIERRNGEEGE